MPRIADREPGACWLVPEVGALLRIGKTGVNDLIKAGKLEAYDVSDGIGRKKIRISDKSLQAYLDGVKQGKPAIRRKKRRLPKVKSYV